MGRGATLVVLAYLGIICWPENHILGSQPHVVLIQDVKELDKIVFPNWKHLASYEYVVARTCAAVSDGQGNSEPKDWFRDVLPCRPFLWTENCAIQTTNMCFRWSEYVTTSFPGCRGKTLRSPKQTAVFGHLINQNVEALPVADSPTDVYSVYGVGDVLCSYFPNVHQFEFNKDTKPLAFGIKATVVNAFGQSRAQCQPWSQIARGDLLCVRQSFCAFRNGAFSSLDAFDRGLGALTGQLHRSASQPERVEQGSCAHEGEGCLKPSGVALGLGRISCSLCGGRRPLLGYEIVGLTLLGALFALPGTLGLCWVFDDPRRHRRLAGWLLAAICLPLTLTLYGWARLGAPGAIWGLCG